MLFRRKPLPKIFLSPGSTRYTVRNENFPFSFFSEIRGTGISHNKPLDINMRSLLQLLLLLVAAVAMAAAEPDPMPEGGESLHCVLFRTDFVQRAASQHETEFLGRKFLKL